MAAVAAAGVSAVAAGVTAAVADGVTAGAAEGVAAGAVAGAGVVEESAEVAVVVEEAVVAGGGGGAAVVVAVVVVAAVAVVPLLAGAAEGVPLLVAVEEAVVPLLVVVVAAEEEVVVVAEVAGMRVPAGVGGRELRLTAKLRVEEVGERVVEGLPGVPLLGGDSILVLARKRLKRPFLVCLGLELLLTEERPWSGSLTELDFPRRNSSRLYSPSSPSASGLSASSSRNSRSEIISRFCSSLTFLLLAFSRRLMLMAWVKFFRRPRSEETPFSTVSAMILAAFASEIGRAHV